jgi:hypothetical protein
MREAWGGRGWGNKALSARLVACELCGRDLNLSPAGQLWGAMWTSAMRLLGRTGAMCATPVGRSHACECKPSVQPHSGDPLECGGPWTWTAIFPCTH